MRLFTSLSLVFLAWAASAFAEDKPHVVVIDSYHSGYFWTQETRSGIERSLSMCCKISYFEMNTKNIPPSEFQQMADQAYAFFKEKEPDGVILSDDNAVKFLGQRIGETGIPVSYLGVNENPRDYFNNRLPNVSGVLGRTPYRRNVSFVGRYLDGDLNRVLVLFDNSVTAKAMFDSGFGRNPQLSLPGVQADIMLIRNYDTWQQIILNAKQKGYDALVFMLYHRLMNDKDAIVDPEQVLSWSVQNTPVPPFGIWKFSLKEENGVIGGLMAGGYPQGFKAGEILKQMLIENKRGVPPRMANKGTLMFSYSQLKKWKIQLGPDLAQRAEYYP